LMMGGSERHYTASKLYPGLLAQRPLLAVYHDASSVVDVLKGGTRLPTIRVVTYDDERRAEDRADEIQRHLAELVAEPVCRPQDADLSKLSQFSASRLAAQLADVLDCVAARSPNPQSRQPV